MESCETERPPLIHFLPAPGIPLTIPPISPPSESEAHDYRSHQIPPVSPPSSEYEAHDDHSPRTNGRPRNRLPAIIVVEPVPTISKLSDNQIFTNETSSNPIDLSTSESTQRQRYSHGKRVIDGFLVITKVMIYIASLGASFLFSSIISEPQPSSTSFGSKKMRFLLTLGWLLFLTTLGLSCLLTLLIIFNTVEIAETWKKDKKWFLSTFVICVIILCCFIGAYACIGLALIAYQFWVGIIGFCLAGLVFIVTMIVGVIQLYRELTLKYYIATDTY